MRTAIMALTLAGAASVAMAQAPGRVEVVETVHRWMAEYFSLEKLPPVDPALRQQGEALAAQHLLRMKEMLTAWAEREDSRATGAAPHTLTTRGAAWVANEVAAWRADSLGPEDDALQRRLLTAPGICRHFDELSAFAYLLVQMQTLPAAERARALVLEHERLARWGSPRAGLPPWPQPPPQDQLEQVLDLARQAQGRISPPMVPVLANALVRDPTKSPLDDPALRCETVRWWLQRAGDSPGALELARLSLMPRPSMREEAGGDETRYPVVARRFGVVGTVVVRMVVGADGKAVAPSVLRRTLTVPGLEDQRPIVFESVFDAASLARAKTMHFAGREGQSHEVAFSWTLE